MSLPPILKHFEKVTKTLPDLTTSSAALTINFMSQQERLVYIDEVLREKGRLTLRQVVDRFEVSERQVKRDIEYLRYRLSAPLIFDTKKKIYTYSQPYDKLKFADERLILFYVLVRSLAESEIYLPLASGEILENLEKSIARDYRGVANKISYGVSVSESVDLEIFSFICRALLEERSLDLGYTNSRGENGQRRVDALRLQNYSGRWYLIAWDHKTGSLRTFHLSRMSQLALCGDAVVKSEADPVFKNELEKFLEGGFGIFKGNAVSTVVVRFHPEVVSQVRHQCWHADQEDVESEDGSLERRLPVADTSELLSRVLSFGALAQALKPESFRSRWKNEIRKMMELAQ